MKQPCERIFAREIFVFGVLFPLFITSAPTRTSSSSNAARALSLSYCQLRGNMNAVYRSEKNISFITASHVSSVFISIILHPAVDPKRKSKRERGLAVVELSRSIASVFFFFFFSPAIKRNSS